MDAPTLRFDATTLRFTVARPVRVVLLGAPEAPEVWIALHGYGQLAADFARSFEPFAGTNRRIAVPEAPSRFYLDKTHQRIGASWMTREDRAAEIESYCAYLDAVAAHVAPGRPVQVLGFSQGAHTAARWAVFGQTPIARIVLWGVPLPDDLDPDAHRARLPGLTLVAGDADPFVAPARLDPCLARLDAAGLPYRLQRYAGAHALDDAVLADLLGGATA